MQTIKCVWSLLFLLVLTGSLVASGRLFCYRRLRKRGTCGGMIRPARHTFTDAHHCCSRRGQGFAERKIKLGRNRFECTPCSNLLKHPSSSSSPSSPSSASSPSSSSSSFPRRPVFEKTSTPSAATTAAPAPPELTTATPTTTTDFRWPTPGRRDYVAYEFPPWRGGEGDVIVWQEWSPCSVSCGAGWRSRAKVCDGCDLNDYENVRVQPCMDNFYCPVDGNWGPWLPWGTCSTTCSAGTRTRTRKCNYPPPAFGGTYCPGEGLGQKECLLENCPVDGGWGAWSRVSACSATCGHGQAVRSRECDSPVPTYGGSECQGPREDTQRCKVANCPVDGAWSGWSVWGECSVTCGLGVREQVRSCDNPRPRHGGQGCQGEARMLQECSAQQPCPVDGGWSEWSAYSSRCRARPCAKGFRVRSRKCTFPRPASGGRACKGKRYERIECFNDQNCPENGGWCPWSQWNACSSSCAENTSVRGRQRNCACPPSTGGGLECQGDSLEIEECRDIPRCDIPGELQPTRESKTEDEDEGVSVTTTSGGPTTRSRLTEQGDSISYRSISTERSVTSTETAL